MPEFNPENWKVEINTFLYSRLPPETTIKEMDDLACAMFEMVEDFYRKQKEPAKADHVLVVDGSPEDGPSGRFA